MNNINKLEWEDRYSVGVAEIDLQHQNLIKIINDLIDLLSTNPDQEKLNNIINSLLDYKKYHFSTEEEYFEDFNYEGTEEHILAHHHFSDQIQSIQDKNKDNSLGLAYDLVDFLEDWLIDHLQTLDQEYRQCFISHGLK